MTCSSKYSSISKLSAIGAAEGQDQDDGDPADDGKLKWKATVEKLLAPANKSQDHSSSRNHSLVWSIPLNLEDRRFHGLGLLNFEPEPLLDFVSLIERKQ